MSINDTWNDPPAHTQHPWGAIDIGAFTNNICAHRLLKVKIDSAPDILWWSNANSGLRVQYISKDSGSQAIEFERYTHGHPQHILASDVGACHHWLADQARSTWPLRLSCLDHTHKDWLDLSQQHALGESSDFALSSIDMCRAFSYLWIVSSCRYQSVFTENGMSGNTPRNWTRLFPRKQLNST